MKMAKGDKVFFRHHQLPLGFNKTDPGDLKRVLAFLDDNSPAEPPVTLSKVFSRFSGQPDAWSGARIAEIISCLFSNHMISCSVNGNVFQHHHAGVFLETPDQWERILVIPRKRLVSSELDAVVSTCQKIFGMDCPPDQDDLAYFLVDCLKQWKASLTGFGRMAEAGQYPGAADIRSCLSFIQVWLTIPDPYDKIRALSDGKAALVSFSHIVVRLKDFYENGIGRWGSWQKSLEKFTAFQPEIEDDPEAAVGLSKLRRVLAMQSPWNDLECMDDIISRIKPVYDRIRDERFNMLQRDTLLQINRMIETISGLLENVHARDAVRNTALVELQKIKKAIELDRPGGLISKQREIAEQAFEKAQDIVLSQS
ncbi:MAG: hypothetical protein HY881_06815 [Deltaproteobacteria bacterium]|nr:hypothetical protein [Deltaproteobacteria bacterium]